MKEEEWDARAAVIRPLCAVQWVGRVVIAAAVRELELRSVRVYR